MCVNRLCAVDEAVNQRMAKVRGKRSFRTVGYRNFKTAGLVIALNVVGSENQIVFTAFFDDSRRPDRAPYVRKAAHIDNALVLCPMYKIIGGKGVEIHLFSIAGERARDINVIAPVIAPRLRICVPAGHDRIMDNRHIKFPFRFAAHSINNCARSVNLKKRIRLTDNRNFCEGGKDLFLRRAAIAR